MMKHSLILLICMFSSIFFSYAQNENSAYLFDEFKDATIFLKGNAQTQEKMNYDLLLNEFLFIDRSTGDVKQVMNIDDIIVVRMDNRSFYKEKDGVIEVISLNKDLTLYVQYRIKSKTQAPTGAYGGRTETSSVTSYSGMYLNNNHVDFDPKKVIPAGRYNIYWIEKDDKKKAFKTFKQFVKIYSKHKDRLENYIQEHNIRFEDVGKIKELCIYADSL